MEWLGGLLSRLYDLLPEIFMLQNTGIFDGGINYPCWQLTTLLIVSHIMYSLLVFNKQLARNAICPIIVLLVYTFFHHTGVTQEVANWGVIQGLFYMPLIRALAGVALGVVIYEPVCRLKSFVEKKSKQTIDYLVNYSGIMLYCRIYSLEK